MLQLSENNHALASVCSLLKRRAGADYYATIMRVAKQEYDYYARNVVVSC